MLVVCVRVVGLGLSRGLLSAEATAMSAEATTTANSLLLARPDYVRSRISNSRMIEQ